MRFIPSKRPFVGLRSFESNEIDIFFGREKLIGEMLDRLSEHRFLAVTGISGGGKSSLVKTGLVDGLKNNLILEAGSIWTIIEIRPHNRPIYSLAESLLNKTPKDRRYPNDIEFLVSRLKRNPKDLVVFLEENRRFFEGSLLIIIDQFEEIFRYEENDSHVISDVEFNNVMILVDILIHSSNQEELKIYNIITIRSDYLGKCALFNGLPELINKSQFIIPRLTRDELHDAIEYPVKMHKGKIEPALTNRILNDLGHDLDQLPQMQHALMRMWDITKKNNSEEPKLTLELYEKNGGLQDSISHHADEIYNTLNDKEKKVCKKIFVFITRMNSSSQLIRRPQQIKDICIGINEELKVIESITNQFRKENISFLRPNAKNFLSEDMILDITHESIMRQWKRLKVWIKEESQSASEYKGLSIRAKRYEDKVGALLTEPDLTRLLKWKEESKPTLEWAERYGGNFEFVIGFLEKSREVKSKEDKEKGKRKRNQKIIGLTTLFLIISLISYLIYDEIRISKQDKEIAEKNEKESKHNEEIAIANAKLLEQEVKIQKEHREKEIAIANAKLLKKEFEVEKERREKEIAIANEKLLKKEVESKEEELLTITNNIELVESIINEYKKLLKDKRMLVDKSSDGNNLSKLKNIDIKINKQRNKLFKKKKFFLKHQESSKVQNILIKINTYLAKDIKYYTYNEAVNLARQNKKIILVLVYYYDCENCVEVDQYLEEDRNIRNMINKNFKDVRINKYYNQIPSDIKEGVRVFPTLVFMSPTTPTPKILMQISEISGEKELNNLLQEAINDGHKGGFLRP